MAPHTGTTQPNTGVRPFTGAEHLESLPGLRDIWSYSERVTEEAQGSGYSSQCP